MSRIARMVGGGLFALVAGAGSFALAAEGCSSASPNGPGGGSPTTSVTTGVGGSKEPPVPCLDVLDASIDVFGPGTPGPEDVALCEGLELQALKCHPGCAVVPLDPCEQSSACMSSVIRQDMIADLYACMSSLPCADLVPLGGGVQPFGTCAGMLRPEYPPSPAEQAVEEAVQQWASACGGPDAASPCAGGVCGGYDDEVYGAVLTCAESYTSCFSVGLCFDFAFAQLFGVNCPLLTAWAAGASDGGEGDAGDGAADGG